MKHKLLLLIFISISTQNFAQKNLLKLGGHPSINPFAFTIGLMAEIAYERVLVPKNSLQIAFNVRQSADLGTDGGGHFGQSFTVQYRYYFSKAQQDIQKSAYIAGGLRQTYLYSGGTYWTDGESKDWGLGIGVEIGQHFQLGKYGVANPYAGLYVSSMYFTQIIRGEGDGVDMIYYTPPKVETGYYPYPILRLGCNLGIAWGGRKKAEK